MTDIVHIIRAVLVRLNWQVDFEGIELILAAKRCEAEAARIASKNFASKQWFFILRIRLLRPNFFSTSGSMSAPGGGQLVSDIHQTSESEQMMASDIRWWWVTTGYPGSAVTSHRLSSRLEVEEWRSTSCFEALRSQTNPFYIRRCQLLGLTIYPPQGLTSPDVKRIRLASKRFEALLHSSTSSLQLPLLPGLAQARSRRMKKRFLLRSASKPKESL